MAREKKTAEIEEIKMQFGGGEENETPSPRKRNLSTAKKTEAKIPETAMILVKSNRFGGMIMVDPSTNEEFHWDSAGEIISIPLTTLRHIKAGAAKFFSENMILIVGFDDENADIFEVADIYKALFIEQYYKNFIDPTNFDELMNMNDADLEYRVKMLTPESKTNLIVALNEYIRNGSLDSLSKIRKFERMLDCELYSAIQE